MPPQPSGQLPATLRRLLIFALLVLVLAVRPLGLFGRPA